MPQEYDKELQKMKLVNANAVYIVLAELPKDGNTAEMGKILSSYCFRSSGSESVRFSWLRLVEYLQSVNKWLNF